MRIIDARRRGLLSARDEQAIDDFRRFLGHVGKPQRGAFRRAPGFVPYALGGPAPPPGLERDHVTAWPFPC